MSSPSFAHRRSPRSFLLLAVALTALLPACSDLNAPHASPLTILFGQLAEGSTRSSDSPPLTITPTTPTASRSPAIVVHTKPDPMPPTPY